MSVCASVREVEGEGERESMTEGPVDRRESIEFKAYVTSLTSRDRTHNRCWMARIGQARK